MSHCLWHRGPYSSWNSPGQNTGVSSLSLLQGIFPTQGSNPGLPHCRQILYQLSHKRSPRILEWVPYPFSRGSSCPRNHWGLLHCMQILYQLSYQGVSEWEKSLSHVQLFATPWTVTHQAPPSMGFSRQEYWSGLPFPSPGDLPNPGIEPRSPALQADTLTSEPPGKPIYNSRTINRQGTSRQKILGSQDWLAIRHTHLHYQPLLLGWMAWL